MHALCEAPRSEWACPAWADIVALLLLLITKEQTAMSVQMRTCLQGPDLATADKERGPGALKMRQPLFISDIPSAGMVPPQVCAPLCNAPARQQRRHHVFLLVCTRPSKALCGCHSSYNRGVHDMLLPMQPTLACTGRGSSVARQLDQVALVALQVEASLLWNFQALLEHSGEVAGLHGAVLSISGVLYTLQLT